MLPIRVYLIALALLFSVLTLMTRSLGTLDAIVLVCAPLFVILDLRVEQLELRKLESQIGLLSSSKSPN